jgi:NitT/TauT family transport system substrate-binding protein
MTPEIAPKKRKHQIPLGRQAMFMTLTAVVLTLLLSGGNAQAAPPQTAVIADQFGPGHLVTLVMKQRRLLESRFPSTTFEWRIVTSGAIVRDGMMTDRIHVGLSAPPPFLLGLDKGVTWKIVAAAATYDQWLLTKDPTIRTFKDFTSGGQKQIAVVGFDSFPAIQLKKLAQQEFGDAKALDTHLVIMPPPQAIQAMLSGQLAGAAIPPVHMVRAVDAGARIVVERVFSGPVTNNFYVMMAEFINRHPDFAQGFHDAVDEAVRYIHDKPNDAFQMLADEEKGKTSSEQYRDLIKRSGTEFSTIPNRILEVGEFMKKIGMIQKLPRSLDEVSFMPLGGT